MTELPDAVKHALRFYDATAADLAAAGGILRCSTCGAARPVGDIASYLAHGWPECCGLTMTWVTAKLLAAEAREPLPEGYELAAVVSPDWRLVTGKPCARKVGRGTCRRPAVAELNRGHDRRGSRDRQSRIVDAWWPYCMDHMYGNWIEDGKVMHWILREVASGA